MKIRELREALRREEDRLYREERPVEPGVWKLNGPAPPLRLA